jgi:hypothetical protein
VKINEKIEPLFREALGAAVAQEEQRFDSAITVIVEERGQDFSDALNLALNVCRVTLFAIHKGGQPADSQLMSLASAFETSEAWAGLAEGDALTFLTALADQRSVQEVLPLKASTPLVFVVGAWLLSAFRPADQPWYSVLDEMLNVIEHAPAGD